MKVSLVRHTSVELDGNFTCYGALDVEVNPTFEQEAKGAKERIEGLQPDGVFTSPLQRAVKLATYCGYGHAERDDRLREMNFGAWEGRSFNDVNAEHSDTMKRFYNDPEHADIPESEPFPVFQKRVAGRVREIVRAHQGKRIVIVSHGASIRILLADILAMPIRSIWHVSQLNTAVNKIRFEDDGFAIVTLMNDTSHLCAGGVR